MRWVPDALSYVRFGLTFATYGVVFLGDAALFTVLVLLIVLTDMLDGPLARRMRIADRRGSNLDSSADFLFYASLPVWTYAFRPEAVLALLPYVAVFFVAYVAVNILSRVRRGVMGFHNRWTRFAGTLGVLFALWTVIYGIEPVLFWSILVFLTLDIVQRSVNLARARPRASAAHAVGATPGGRDADE